MIESNFKCVMSYVFVVNNGGEGYVYLKHLAGGGGGGSYNAVSLRLSIFFMDGNITGLCCYEVK